MKDDILNSAMHFFLKKGYSETNMEEVADKANVTKEMMYYHFQSKSQLFTETIISYERQLEEKVIEAASLKYNTDMIAFNIIKLCVEFFTDYQYIADTVISENPAGSDRTAFTADIIAEIRKAKNHFIVLISYLIDEGIASGHIRNCNSRITASSVIYYIYTYCSQLRESGKYDKEAAAVRINDILMNGMKK